MQAHQDYWLHVIDKGKKKIPDLEVYVVNVHPSKGESIPDDDHDGVKDRINDIIFFDRNSHYDENVTDTATDYTVIITKLKHIAKGFMSSDKIDAFEDDFENWLKMTDAKSKSNKGENRTYRDILYGGFKLTNVIRIEHKGYENSISGKISDFTSKTIKHLIQQGKEDASDLVNGSKGTSNKS